MHAAATPPERRTISQTNVYTDTADLRGRGQSRTRAERGERERQRIGGKPASHSQHVADLIRAAAPVTKTKIPVAVEQNRAHFTVMVSQMGKRRQQQLRNVAGTLFPAAAALINSEDPRAVLNMFIEDHQGQQIAEGQRAAKAATKAVRATRAGSELGQEAALAKAAAAPGVKALRAKLDQSAGQRIMQEMKGMKPKVRMPDQSHSRARATSTRSCCSLGACLPDLAPVLALFVWHSHQLYPSNTCFGHRQRALSLQGPS